MNRVYNKDSRLESHRFFHWVAWAVIILFAVFVYHLANSVSEKKEAIAASQIDEDAYLVPIDELRQQNISE